MNTRTSLSKKACFAVALGAGLLSAWFIRVSSCKSAGQAVATAVHEQAGPLEERRARLVACAKRMAGCSAGPLLQPEMPSEEVLKIMGAREKDSLARGVHRILTRLESTNSCSDAEIEWGRKTLALLKASDGDEAKARICRVSKIPLHTIQSLEKVNQLEVLTLAVYPELISMNEVPPVSFKQSAIKKKIIRRQLHLLEKGRDDK
jgi:hypothetical protein